MSLQQTLDDLVLEPGYVVLGPECSWADALPQSDLCYREVLKMNATAGGVPPGFVVGKLVLVLDNATQVGLEDGSSIWLASQASVVGTFTP